MTTVWLILIGLFGGIVGGMGMGGGTVLVPMMTLLDYDQVTVQGINLVSFVPMCVIALVIHGAKGRINARGIWWILVPAVLSAVVGALLAHHIEQQWLTVMYGVMLLAVGIWQIVVSIKGIRTNSNNISR